MNEHNPLLARPYAKAAFFYAKERGQLAEWTDMLRTLALLIGEPKVAELLVSPGMTKTQMGELFIEFCEGSLNEYFKNFIRLLAESGRLAIFPDVFLLYEELKTQEANVVKAEVISALPMIDDQKKQLIAALKKRFDCDVEPDYEIDQSLLGGMIVRVNDFVIDASARSQLSRLAKQIRA